MIVGSAVVTSGCTAPGPAGSGISDWLALSRRTASKGGRSSAGLGAFCVCSANRTLSRSTEVSGLLSATTVRSSAGASANWIGSTAATTSSSIGASIAAVDSSSTVGKSKADIVRLEAAVLVRGFDERGSESSDRSGASWFAKTAPGSMPASPGALGPLLARSQAVTTTCASKSARTTRRRVGLSC